MGDRVDESDVAVTGRRIESLLGELTRLEPRIAATAEDLVREVTGLYAEALARIVDALDEGTVRRLAADQLVGGLLMVHELHPDDLATRVRAALDAVRPALGAHAGGVELLGIGEEDDGAVVALRLEGSCHGCPSSLVTVRQSIERAILGAAPEVVRVDVEGLHERPAEPALLQIQPMRPYAEDGSECPAVVGAAT
ncbi:MAG: NifU family protein [Frankiaceae bacterium]